MFKSWIVQTTYKQICNKSLENVHLNCLVERIILFLSNSFLQEIICLDVLDATRSRLVPAEIPGRVCLVHHGTGLVVVPDHDHHWKNNFTDVTIGFFGFRSANEKHSEIENHLNCKTLDVLSRINRTLCAARLTASERPHLSALRVHLGDVGNALAQHVNRNVVAVFVLPRSSFVTSALHLVTAVGCTKSKTITTRASCPYSTSRPAHLSPTSPQALYICLC